ncbi:uncharacterized protein LOC133391733 [Anopheles gambiae]|uniref:uncharacterized protein LOC133391733 n=1 Tax=Anopheles gambiae TaxID=7165 RepID=UPI002AC9C56E|nr:uncharacterized protein LOC133391733 [Anopheles gambiae]
MIPLIMLIDEERQEDKRNEQRYRRHLRIQRNVLNLPYNKFIRDYRVSPAIFEEIIWEIKDEISPLRSHGITPEQKLAAVLRFFAEGSFQQSVGKDFYVPVANTTFSKCIYEIIAVLQVCDDTQIIGFVNAKYGGASHDSHVWNRSPVGRFCSIKHRNLETGFKISGDSAYPRADWLIVPCRNATANSAEAEFNTLHTAARIIIERTIGVLKSRFRCLSGQRELLHTAVKCLKIINVCCALHNMCINYRVNF